ncbi:MAG: LruC domain-containing protein [Methylovulum sp.]|nr:LruC domain-containing protein [Methylovulum sp.]
MKTHTNTLKKIQPLLGAALLLASASVTAKDWQYFGDYDANTGTPKSMVDMSGKLPSDLISRVLKKLPEGQNISKNSENLVTDDLGANIYLLKDAQVTVSFVSEGAGYLNSLGFFKFNAEDLPSKSQVQDSIIFPNISTPPLKYGNGIDLGKFKAGEAIGFTVMANGWKPNLRKVDPNQSADWIFRTIKGLNPEVNDANNYRAHNVLLSNAQDGFLIIGFEDMNRTPGKGSDNDFNDVVIAVHVTPFSAVDRSQMNDLAAKSDLNKIDTDGDGVPDYLDAFPQDKLRSAQRFYPSASGYGHLAFEDQWPVKGDYDLNDVVINYRTIETLNAKNQVTDVDMVYEIAARGGVYQRGFGVHLPGVSKDTINKAATTLTWDNQAAVALSPEDKQKEAVFIVAPDIKAITNTGQGYPCSFFNTWNQCPKLPSPRFVAHVSFNTPQATMGKAPYNPFIFATNRRGLETHLVDLPPTDLADPRLFGTYDDTSDIGQKRYYRTASNLPWALDIPDNWLYPSEQKDITLAYGLFETWAEANGTKNSSWYLNATNKAYVYLGK